VPQGTKSKQTHLGPPPPPGAKLNRDILRMSMVTCILAKPVLKNRLATLEISTAMKSFVRGPNTLGVQRRRGMHSLRKEKKRRNLKRVGKKLASPKKVIRQSVAVLILSLLKEVVLEQEQISFVRQMAASARATLRYLLQVKE
jgi:hypothetical protein